MVNRTRRNGGATIDVKTVCPVFKANSACFEFRVTSVQNHRGSGSRSNNGTGVIFGMIHFSAGLLLSVGQSSTLIVKIKSVHVTRECHNLKYIQGVQDRIENFFEGSSDFTEDGSFGQFYLRFHRNPYANDLSLKGGGGSSEPGVGGNSMKPLWNRDRSVTLNTFRECHNQKNRQRLPNSGIARDCQNKLLPVSITIKSTDRECHD